MRALVSNIVVGAIVFSLQVSEAGAAPVDCTAARCAIAGEIDAECPCAVAVNHGRYTSCVARVVNRAARDGRIPKRCRPKINGCYIRSLCGKPSRVVLCDPPGDGSSGRCRPLPFEDECVRRSGVVVGSCCEPCGAASPSPTASAPSPTTTPAAPVATLTPVEPAPSATPSGAAPTATPLVAATETANATVTPATTATATAVATPTIAATPAATPTAVETETPGALASPTATIASPVATATTQPVPTPTGLPLFVDIEGDPDVGPAPLTVDWTTDVTDGTPPYSFRWNFGDGTPEVTIRNPTHVYELTGDFTAVLTVTDALGVEETADFDVTVESE